jgi:predicted ATPase/DNA-binding SARP family transcriptional activator
MCPMHSLGEEPVLQVRVLGPTDLSAADEPIRLDRLLERALAVRLALARGAGVADEALARDLWGDVDLTRPTERLRVLASRLRRSLGEQSGAVRRTAAGFALRAVPADLDAAEAAIGRAQAARRAGDRAAAHIANTEALALWRGAALADLRAVPFACTEGERLDALRLDVQVDWFEVELDHESTATRADLEQLAAAHPLHERLVCLAALSLYRTGRQAEALDRLAKLKSALAEELGVDPSPATAELELRLLRQDPVLDRPLPPATTPSPPATSPVRLRVNWPPAMEFVGRDGELASLADQLTDPGLVTLTGGPGTGKTRLAREVAVRVQATDRPVAWLDLAQVSSPDAVAPRLVTAAGLEAAPGDPVPRCARALAGALLVVDNAEHLVDAVAVLLNSLRLATPGLSVLVTSQGTLRISGEEVHRVGPLPANAAARLFCSRSGAAPGPEVDAICAAVDRLPLGIELAAGLTRTLTVPQLAARIDDRLRLLVGGPRDAGGRHTSLRTALDWSHDLLGEPARTVWRRLSVFAGGCTLEAAEQVLAGEGLEPADVAVQLGLLADRCLVTVRESAGGRRFGMLETVRQYAADLLGTGAEDQAVRRRHADWCVELAARTEEYGGSDHLEFTRELIAEESNLRAALGWCLDGGGDPALVLQIVTPSWWYWWTHGMMTDARDWLRRALAATESAGPADRAAALRAAASLTRNSGNYTEARELGESALRFYREAGDFSGETAALLGLAITAAALQDHEEAYALAESARVRGDARGNLRVSAAAGNMVGITLRCMGRGAEAVRIMTAAYQQWLELDDPRGMGGTECGLGILAQQRGDLAESREWFLRGLRHYHEIGMVEGLLDCLDGIAGVDVLDGRPEQALRLLTVAGRHRDRLGAPLFIADEIAYRESALAAAIAALGDETGPLVAAARELAVEPVVEELLG